MKLKIKFVGIIGVESHYHICWGLGYPVDEIFEP